MSLRSQEKCIIPTRRTFRWWFYLFTPIMSVAFTLAVLELGFIIFHPILFSIEINMYFEPDTFTGFKLKPNSTGYFQHGITAHVNKNGHRDDFVLEKKKDGVFRILAIGDSFTVGANVNQSDIYTEKLENLFNAKNTHSTEVINAGVGGWDPFQYAQYVEYYGWKFSPDLILVGFFVGNDTYSQVKEVSQTYTAILGRRVTRKAAARPFINIKIFMYNHFNIARLLLKKRPKYLDKTRRHCSDLNENILKVQSDRLYNHYKRTKLLEKQAQNGIDQIKRIKEIGKRASVPVVVVLIPDDNQINKYLQKLIINEADFEKYDFKMPQSMLVDMFTDASIPVIDLLPYFLNDSRCLYMNDTHWNAEGHALAAAAIYENLTDKEKSPNIFNCDDVIDEEPYNR